MLWVDKHRPNKLHELDYHDEVTQRLEALAANPKSLPHLFVYGPPGSGKRTRIAALLNGIFGPSASKLKLEKRNFTTPSGRAVEIHMISSPHHVELSPGDAGINDRFVIQDVLKEMASTKNIRASVGGMQTNENSASYLQNSSSTSGSTSLGLPTLDVKIVVLTQVDRLSKQAQAALRRTMEKYAATCRLILCCNSPSKLIHPLRSRCLGIRVGAPTIDQISYVLQKVAKKESILLPDALAVALARESDRNARRALLMLEAAHVQTRGATGGDDSTGDGGVEGVLKENQALPTTDWELYIQNLAVDITREQSPQRLLAAREKLYELLVNCIPASVIIKRLTEELIKNLDDSLKLQVLEWAAFYEHRISLGSKEIFHLEAFVAKYMAIYKKYLNDLFA